MQLLRPRHAAAGAAAVTALVLAGCASSATLWNEVAAKVKFTAGAGKHLLVYLPRTLSSCQYALAEVGRATTSGGRLYVRDLGSLWCYDVRGAGE